MMSDDIERKVELALNLAENLHQQILDKSKNEIYHKAERDAQRVILLELACRLGSDVERFNAHYEALRNWALAKSLQKISDISKDLGAELDVREMDEVYTDEPPPPLFP